MMIDYQTLKHSDNGMPTWDRFLGPVLQVASTKEKWIGKDLDNAILTEINLPEKLAMLRYTFQVSWFGCLQPCRPGIERSKVSWFVDFTLKENFIKSVIEVKDYLMNMVSISHEN